MISLPTEESELMKPDSKCNLPPVNPSPFSCLAAIPSWTFNSTAGKCESYMYGGCGKTANLFSSQDDCNAACGPKPSKKYSVVAQSHTRRDELPFFEFFSNEKESSNLVKKFVNYPSPRAHVSHCGSDTHLLRTKTGASYSTLVVARATEIISERPTIVTKPAAETNPALVIINYLHT